MKPLTQVIETYNRLVKTQGSVRLSFDGVEYKDYIIISEDYGCREDSFYGHYDNSLSTPTWRTVLREIINLKSKEQIAAEDSVAKAKEALKAAENALKVVKEKK